MATPAPPSKESFFEKVKGLFVHAEVVADEAIVACFGAATAKSIEATLGGFVKSAFGQICVAAVQAAQGMASGTEAHGAAFAQITTAAKSAGLQVENSMVNLGIEMALQAIRGTFGAVI